MRKVQSGWMRSSGMATRHFPASWKRATTRDILLRITNRISRRITYNVTSRNHEEENTPVL